MAGDELARNMSHFLFNTANTYHTMMIDGGWYIQGTDFKPTGVDPGECRRLGMFHHGYEASERPACSEMCEFDSFDLENFERHTITIINSALLLVN